MKTISVSLIFAGILAPCLSLGQEPGRRPGGPPPDGEARRSGKNRFTELWAAVDLNRDGMLSEAEFSKIQRIANLEPDKRHGLFVRLDKDGDGKISREEMSRMGKEHGDARPPMQPLWALDVDRSGGVSFEEFQAGRFIGKLPEERQREMFRRLDTNEDGVITPKDNPAAPFGRNPGEGRPERPDRPERGGQGGKGGQGGARVDPPQMMRQLDSDRDGSLSFEEFRASPAVRQLGEDEQEDRFEKLDADHNQKLTPDEIQAFGARGGPKRPAETPGGR